MASALAPRPRVVLINQFAQPDPAPTGRYLDDLAAGMGAAGWDVTIISSRRGYDGGGPYPDESRLGLELVRIWAPTGGRRSAWRQALGFACFVVGAALTVLQLRRRPTMILSLTTPPWLGAAVGLVAWLKRMPRSDWVMDLYPDALLAHGALPRGGLAAAALATLTRWQFRSAATVVALGPCQARRCRRHNGRRGSVCWLPLWSRMPEDGTNTDPGPDDRPRFLYSGNLGRGHLIAPFLDAALKLGAAGPAWRFAGTGPRRAEVEAFIRAHPELPVVLADPVPEAALALHLRSAEVQLVSLAADWSGVMVPSKLAGILALGLPVLVLAPADSEPALWVREAGAGWVVEPGDEAALLAAIAATGDAQERRRRGEAGARWARRHLDRTRTVMVLARHLASVASTCR